MHVEKHLAMPVTRDKEFAHSATIQREYTSMFLYDYEMVRALNKECLRERRPSRQYQLAKYEERNKMSNKSKLPWWLKPVNRLIIILNRLGLALGTQHIISIPGRRSGKVHSTPVSLLTVNGQRYIVTGFETDWVKNARASGWGFVSRGRKEERVLFTEVPIDERAPILRAFPVQVPHGVEFFERLLGLPNDPQAFAAAAPRCPVFRLEPAIGDE